MTSRTSITGWGHSKFGRLNEPDVTALIGSVVPEALTHAHVEPSEVDGIFVGVYNNGFSDQDFQASLVSLSMPEFQHTPAMRVENACGTGSAALYAACDFIDSGRGDVALVIGAEKMTAVDTPRAGEILLSGCYRPEESNVTGGFAGVFAGIARATPNATEIRARQWPPSPPRITTTA